MKNKINMEKLQIKLCTVNNIEHIYKIQNIVINNFKKVKKAFFCLLKMKVICESLMTQSTMEKYMEFF